MYNNEIGGISWIDLTVKNAEQVQGFYQSVVGMKSESVLVKNYSDYVMSSPTNSDNQVGICHAKGSNSDLPAQWLLYFMCVIQDPAGAAVSLMKKK